MTRLLALCLSMVFSASTDAAPRAYYQPDPPVLPSYPEEMRGQLEQWVYEAIDKRKMRSFQVLPSGGGVEEASMAQLVAVASLFNRGSVGAELDLLVQVADGRGQPVTLWVSPKGDARVAESRQRFVEDSLDGRTLSQWGGYLRQHYGVADLVELDAAWTAREVDVLHTALRRLSSGEVGAVSGLTLQRKSRGGQSFGRPEQARFTYDDRGARIDFFNAAFAFSDAGFVGSLQRPYRPEVLATLHEIGHAVATWPQRAAYLRYEKLFRRAQSVDDPAEQREWFARVEVAWQEYEALGRRGPVMEAFRDVRGREQGPTPYGNQSPWESFAEAFALHHVDPAALKRTMPKVAAWFEQGGHLSWRAER